MHDQVSVLAFSFMLLRDVQASREPAGDTGQSSGSSDNANSCCNSNTEPFSINDLDRVEQLATSVRYTSQAGMAPFFTGARIFMSGA